MSKREDTTIRVYVDNIHSDIEKELAENFKVHELICDCRIDGIDHTEKNARRTFTMTEYEFLMRRGYYRLGFG